MLQILFVYMVMNNLVCIKHFCYIHLYNYAYTSESLTLVTSGESFQISSSAKSLIPRSECMTGGHRLIGGGSLAPI